MNEIFYNYNNLEAYMNKMQLDYDATWLRWVKEIINTKLIMFKYDNLPSPDLTSEIMERALMFNNFLCGYKDPTLGFIICRWRCGSVYNLYWRPERVNLYTLSGQSIRMDVPYNEIVLFRDNPMDIIPFLTLNSWIEKIIEKEKTLDSVFDWLSMPLILTGDKDQVNALKQLMKKSIKRDPFVAAGKGYKDHVEQFDIKLPAELEQIYNIMKKYKGMAMASIGIYEVDEKRERIVTAEIQSQNDFVDMVYMGMYDERKRFIKEVNERWGYNITLREAYEENREANVKNAKDMAAAEKAPDVKIAEIEAQANIQAATQKEAAKDAER